MSITKYEIFRCVVDYKGLSKAAEALNLTQSAVSHAITSLEEEFGFKLLIRNRNGVHTTENGDRMLIYIREILKWNEQMKQEAATIHGLKKGTIRIGTFPSVSIQWIPKLVKQFNNQFPFIHIQLFEGDYDKISSWILDGTIDFGFLSLPFGKNFDTLPLKKDKLLCIVHEQHSFFQEKTVSIQQVQNEPFILPKTSIDNNVRKILQEHEIKPNVLFETSEDQAIISMVQNQIGISILPEMILYRMPENVKAVPLTEEYYRTIGVAAVSLKDLSPASQRIIDLLKTIVADFQENG